MNAGGRGRRSRRNGRIAGIQMTDDYQVIKGKIDLLRTVEELSGARAKKEGSTYRINPCPLCSHKDCFSITPKDQIWNCFSCGKGGDIFSFLELFHSCSSKEALQKAAVMCGHEMQPFNGQGEDGASGSVTAKQKIWQEAAKHYHDELFQNKAASTYQKNKRMHSDAVLKEFQVGYSDGKLSPHLLGLGYTPEEIIGSGLAVFQNGQLKDRFSEGCFVYPWLMEAGRIGNFTCKHSAKKFTFRLSNEFKEPDCLFYNQKAFKNNQIVIVEGEDDCLTVYDKGGYPHGVATCGQLSAVQLEYVEKWIDTIRGKTIFLCFDNDDPGRKYADMFKKTFLKYCFTPRLTKTNRKFIRIIKRRMGEAGGNDDGDGDLGLSALIPEKDFDHADLEKVETSLLTLKEIQFNRNCKDIDECLKKERETGLYFKGVIDNAKSCLIPLKEQLAIAKKWYSVMVPKDQKTKISPDEQGEVIFDYIREVGNFFIEGDECRFFDGNEVYTIANNSPFVSYFYRMAGINFAQNQTKNILVVLRALAYERGKNTLAPGWIWTDIEYKSIFFNLCNEHHELLKITPGHVEVVPNGINQSRILLTSSPKMRPLAWLPDVSVHEAMGHFKDILINLACSNSDKFLIACFIVNTILIDFTKARGFRKYSGSHESGKTSAARFETMLTLGCDGVTTSSAAANFSDAAKAPITIEDNLENDRLHHMETFLTISATGGTRQKRKSGTDSENVYERSNTQIIMTSIEPLLKSELVSRSIEIIFAEKNFNPDFIESTEIAHQILKHRDMIWSALISIVSNDILPDLYERRKEALKKLKMEYPNHSKKRLNELLSCLYIICRELLKYIKLPYDNPAVRGHYRNADELLDCWITKQNQLSRDTTIEANPILHNLELLFEDLRRMQDASFKEVFLFKGNLLYPDNFDNQPIGCRFLASSRDLFTAFNILAKRYGGQNPYKNTRTLTERLKDSVKVMEADGWLYVEDEGMVRGYKRHSFTKYFP